LIQYAWSTLTIKIFDRWFASLGKPGPALMAMYLINATPE
jgi:hypothetical protein